MPRPKYSRGACLTAREFLASPVAPTMKSLAYELGITYTTLCAWKREHTEFAQAVKQGLDERAKRLERGDYVQHYTPGKCTQVVELMSHGMSMAQAAANMGISIQLFNDWRKTYDEFEEAVQYGKTLSQAWHEQLGQDSLQQDFNATVWKTIMKSRYGYQDEVTIKGDADNPLMIEKQDSAAAMLLETLLGDTVQEGKIIDQEAIEVDDDEEQ